MYNYVLLACSVMRNGSGHPEVPEINHLSSSLQPVWSCFLKPLPHLTGLAKRTETEQSPLEYIKVRLVNSQHLTHTFRVH